MLPLVGQPSYIPMAEARGFTKDLLMYSYDFEA